MLGIIRICRSYFGFELNTFREYKVYWSKVYFYNVAINCISKGRKQTNEGH